MSTSFKVFKPGIKQESLTCINALLLNYLEEAKPRALLTLSCWQGCKPHYTMNWYSWVTNNRSNTKQKGNPASMWMNKSIYNFWNFFVENFTWIEFLVIFKFLNSKIYEVVISLKNMPEWTLFFCFLCKNIFFKLIFSKVIYVIENKFWFIPK